MGAAALAVIALVVAVVALALAGALFSSWRRTTAALHTGETSIGELRATLASARESLAAATARLEAMERELEAARAASQSEGGRVETLERRLSAAEGRLAEVAAAPPLPPPIPIGRRAPALDDLRATLRAQAAAEAAERRGEDDDPAEAETAEAAEGK